MFGELIVRPAKNRLYSVDWSTVALDGRPVTYIPVEVDTGFTGPEAQQRLRMAVAEPDRKLQRTTKSVTVQRDVVAKARVTTRQSRQAVTSPQQRLKHIGGFT